MGYFKNQQSSRTSQSSNSIAKATKAQTSKKSSSSSSSKSSGSSRASSSSGSSKSSGSSRGGATAQNQKAIYEGLKNIKGDTSTIRADTSIIKNQNYTINSKVNKIGSNQAVSYSTGAFSQKNIYYALGGVSSLVTAGTIATTDAIKDLTTVIVVVGILLFVGVGAIGWLVFEKFNELNKKLEVKKNV